jgi:tungstate transport system permease protein
MKVKAVKETCMGLGLGKFHTIQLLLYECRYPILSAIAAGFGRAIAEVGAIMMVGGNIQYKTRVLTTAIVLETGKGNYGKALALGIVLLLIAFIVNWGIGLLQERGNHERRRTSS